MFDFFKKKPLSDEILVDGIDTKGKPKDDNIPWIRIEGWVENDRIRTEVDWTSGLIRVLRTKYNYIGTSDEQIVHKFIAEMHAQQISEMNEDDYV